MGKSFLEEAAAGRTPSVFPLTVDQLHRMIEAGIFKDGDRVELIEGVLLQKDTGSGDEPVDKEKGRLR